MRCRNCNIELDSSVIYCEKCGVKVRKEDIIKFFTYSELLIHYYDLEYELDHINEQISSLALKEAYLEKLIKRKKGLSNHLDKVQMLIQKEKKDYDNLLKISISSIKARIKGLLDEKKKKEEIEYYEVLINYKENQKIFESVLKDIDREKKEIEHIQKLKQKIPEIDKELQKILYKLTKGRSTNKLIELEQEYKDIKTELYTLKKNEPIYIKAINYLEKGRIHLGRAVHKVSSAQKIIGNIIFDLIRNKKLNIAKKEIHDAMYYIDQANDLVDILDNVHIDFLIPNSYMIGLRNNFIFDSIVSLQLSQTINSVKQAYEKVRQMREALIGLLRIREQKSKILIVKINKIRKEIMKERESLL
ncbi:MAG: hypothetical protein JXA99_10100 [Candidatus Lokiarchaeota archaeon]|nr:hypothetical protein [Candidatus Lokiarchaeota archaeon]